MDFKNFCAFSLHPNDPCNATQHNPTGLMATDWILLSPMCCVSAYFMVNDSVYHSSFRSAYVTFASEVSVDKALGLSRTSFFSRSIKVSRKQLAIS